MKHDELKQKTGIKKVPTHPNKSTCDDWLDLYEGYSRVSPSVFPDGLKGELIGYIKERLLDQRFDDKNFYILNMHLRDVDEIVVRRRSVKNKRKNSALSRIAKRRWRRNRHKYKRALKKFHRSSKGKDFHKSLGRFLRKSLKKKEEHSFGFEITDEMLVSLMKALNSAMTHFLIEFEHKYKYDDYEYDEDFTIDLLEITIRMTDQMLLDLTEAMRSEGDIRYDIFHDVIYLAGEILIPTGIETEYDYEG